MSVFSVTLKNLRKDVLRLLHSIILLFVTLDKVITVFIEAH